MSWVIVGAALIGIDIIEVTRIRDSHKKFGDRFLNRILLPDEIVYSVLGYFFLFFITVASVAAILGSLGLDPVTAWSGAASAVANVGPGLGEIIGPSGTYQDLPKLAKWSLMTGMIVGRLEIITALVVLTPSFWRA